MASGDFKDFSRGTTDKILPNKAFDIAKNPKHDEYQHGLALKVYIFFDKKKNISNKELAKELQKFIRNKIIRKFKKRKVHSSFIDNIWGADLADMQLISKINVFDFYYLLLIFLLNTHGLFLLNIKNKRYKILVDNYHAVLTFKIAAYAHSRQK